MFRGTFSGKIVLPFTRTTCAMNRNATIAVALLGLLAVSYTSWHLLKSPSHKENESQELSESVIEHTEISEPTSVSNTPSLTTSKILESRSIAELEAFLAKLSKEEAIAHILFFLNSGINAPTGQSFAVGRGGIMKSSPSLRTYLLDKLGQLDPKAALPVSKEILEEKNSSAEYALALRNFTWATSTNNKFASREDEAYFNTKSADLLYHQPWLEKREVAYLEAYDSLTLAPRPELLQRLTELIQPDQPRSSQYAAYLTLTRQVNLDTEENLTILLNNPDWMSSRPETRADLFAKLNPSSEEAAHLLNKYIGSPSISEKEKIHWVNAFPNLNGFVMNHLINAHQSTPQTIEQSRYDNAILYLESLLAEKQTSPALSTAIEDKIINNEG